MTSEGAQRSGMLRMLMPVMARAWLNTWLSFRWRCA